MKTAIVYYSCHHGNTRKLIDAIAAQYEVTLIDVTKVKAADLTEYDCIGFASGIYVSSFAKQVLAFAEENLPEGKTVFFMNTCGFQSPVVYFDAIRKIAEGKKCREAGTYQCLGYDTFGPFKLVGGIAKGHPDEKDLEGAVRFFGEIKAKTEATGEKSRFFTVTDFLAPELDVYARLTEVQLLNREFPEKGMFIAESPKVIGRALDAGYEPVSCLMEKRHIEGEGREILGRMKEVPVYCAEADVLTQLTGFKLTRGMLCAMKRKTLPTVKEICENKRRIVILDKVMNPTNVGAVIRSAAALGMEAVLLTPGCSDPLYRRAARVSMGTVFQIEWTFLSDDSFDEIKALGFKTAAMALKDNSLSVDDPRLTSEERLAVIMGTEGDGLSDSTIAESDYTVKIPMHHGVDSLNVAAASAVAFYQLGKQG